jgi:hypothetical protein
MALGTYTDLQTDVGNWLDRADLSAYIPDLITLGEDRIFTELRVREMEVALNSVMAGGVIAVPSDYLEFKFVYIDGSPINILRRMDSEAMYSEFPLRSSEGKPNAISRNASNFEFGPYPDQNYTVKGTYYGKPTPLVTSGTTNTLFPAYPTLYLYASLCAAEPFLKNDARLDTWEALYGAGLKRANDQARRERYSGSRVQPRAG